MIQGSLSKMDGVSTAGGFYGMNPSKSPFMGILAHSYYFLVGAGAIPARLLMRHNLGERAFTPFAFFLSIGFFFWYGTIPDLDFKFDTFFIPGGFVGNLYATNDGSLTTLSLWNIVFNPYVWFLLLVIFLGYRHFKNVLKKVNDGKTHYSYYRGDPNFNLKYKIGKKKLGFKVDDRFIRMISEPAIIIRIGLILTLITIGLWYYCSDKELLQGYSSNFYILFGWSFNLGVMVFFSGVCLFLEELGIAMRIRAATLDIIDGEYDMAFIMKNTAEMTASKPSDQPSNAEEIFKESEAISSVAFAGFPEEPVQQDEQDVQANEKDLLIEKLKAKYL